MSRPPTATSCRTPATAGRGEGGGARPQFGGSTFRVDTFDALPANARAYLRRIEALTGVPIAMVSTGPERDETILLHHPFH